MGPTSRPRHSTAVRPGNLPGRSAIPAIVAFIAACDNPQPPTACNTIAQQTLHVGETATVDPCFEDPNMDELALTVESSDRGVATADLRGGGVSLWGVSPGTAKVTVTATDPDEMTGTMSFDVVVPNRPPSGKGKMPPARLIPQGTARWALAQYFEEPDGEVLFYSAASSNDAVASPTVNDFALGVFARAEGTATITVTATDPGGLTATQEVGVTVVEPVRLLRDDFASKESLDDWLFTDANREVRDGKLRMTTSRADALALARTPLSATEWEITASMGNGTGDSWAQILMFTTDSRYTAYTFQLGADTTGTFDDLTGNSETNYRLLVWDANAGWWTAPPDAYGTSDAVKNVNELMQVTFSAQRGHFSAKVDDEELFRIPHGPYPDEVAILGLAVWGLQGTTGKLGIFDWVEVFGLDP